MLKGQNMDYITAFGILGIEGTCNEDTVKLAYRKKLAVNNPEDNPEGFKLLREAYETALTYREDDEPNQEQEKDSVFGELLENLAYTYASLQRRMSEKCWLGILSMDIFKDLEYGEKAKLLLFRFLAENFRLPFDIYRMLDSKFDIVEKQNEYREMISPEFVEYMLQCIEDVDGEFEFPYYYLSGDDEGPIDQFCDKIYELEQKVYKMDASVDSLKECVPLIAFLDNCGLSHPFYDSAKARYLAVNGELAEAQIIVENLLIQPICMENIRYKAHAAATLFICGGDEHAKRILENINTRQDDIFEVHYFLSQFYVKNNEYPEGIEHAREAKRLHRSFKTIHYLKDLCEQYVARYKDRVIATFDFDTCCHLVYAYLDLNQESKALEILLNRSDLGEELDGYGRLLCICYVKIGDTRAAFEIANQYKSELMLRLGSDEDAYTQEEIAWCEDTLNKLKVQNAIDEKDFEKAYSHCRKLLEKIPDDYHSLLYMQKACFYTGRDSEVIELMDKLNSIYPEDSEVYEYGARVFFRYGKILETAQLLDDAKENGLTSFCLEEVMPVLLEYATNARDNEILDGFLEQYNSVFVVAKDRKDPSMIKREFAGINEVLAEVYYYRAQGSRDNGDGIVYVRRAMELDDNKRYTLELIRQLENTGDMDNFIEAEKLLREIAVDGLDFELCIEMARNAVFLEKTSEAVEKILDKAESLADEDSNCYKAIASVYEALLKQVNDNNYLEKANAMRAKAVSLNKMELAECSFYVGINYMQMSNWQEAEENFDICYEICHNHAARRFEAKAIAKQGKFDRALEIIKELEEEIELDRNLLGAKYDTELENFEKIVFDQGLIYEHLEMYHQAKRLYQDFMKMSEMPLESRYVAARRCINLYLYEKKYNKAFDILESVEDIFSASYINYEKARIMRISAKNGNEIEKAGKYIEGLIAESDNVVDDVRIADLEDLLGDLLIYNIGDSFSGFEYKKNVYKVYKEDKLFENIGRLMEIISLNYEAGDVANLNSNLAKIIDGLKSHFKNAGDESLDDIFEKYTSMPFDALGNICIASKYYCYSGRLDKAKAMIDKMNTKDIDFDYSAYEADCMKKEAFAVYCQCAGDAQMAKTLFEENEKLYNMSNISSLKSKNYVVRYSPYTVR